MTETLLDRILANKRREVAAAIARAPLAELERQLATASPVRGFEAAVRGRVRLGAPAVIAEAKRASPSKGVLRDPYDVAAIARSYERGGACCLSVLTDVDFFSGRQEDLVVARAACGLPVLRKDFFIDPYQVVQARAMGADCVLLIVAALDDQELVSMHRLATELRMDVLVEVHDRAELERALAIDATLIGINNRDLRTFVTRLDTTIDLLPYVPAGSTVVTESGIGDLAAIERLQAEDVWVYLVGEAFMRAPDPGAKLHELFLAERPATGRPVGSSSLTARDAAG